MEKEVEEEAEKKKRNECCCQPHEEKADFLSIDLRSHLRSHLRALYFREFAILQVSAENRRWNYVPLFFLFFP